MALFTETLASLKSHIVMPEVLRYLFSSVGYNNKVTVRSYDDFGNVDHSAKTVTPDPTKFYMTDGRVDMQGYSIIWDEGLYIAGLNGSRDNSGLFCTEDNYTMFISPDGGESSKSMVLETMTIYCNGTGSKIFDISGDGQCAFEATQVNFGDIDNGLHITSFGNIEDIRQVLITDSGFYNIDEGLTLDGACGGMRISTSNVLFLGATSLFKKGASLVFSQRILSDINATSTSNNSGASIFEFEESNFTNDASFQLVGANFGNTMTAPITGGILHSSPKSSWVRCVGIRNTYPGGQWYISATASTNLSVSGGANPNKIAGTTTYADLQWFSYTTNNALILNSTQSIEVEVRGNLSFTGTTGDVINIYVKQWDNSASGYVDLSETAGDTINTGGKVVGISFNAIATLNQNDRIELWVENETAARNVTAELNGYVIVGER